MFGFSIQILFIVLPGVLALYDYHLLPETLEPQHYDLRILTHLNDTAQYFEGVVKIDLWVLQTTKNITLHAKNLTIDKTGISVKSSRDSNCIENVELSEKYEFYIMYLCKELNAGEKYILEIPFKGQLNESQTGYYKSSYNDTENKYKTHYLAVTQFSPTFARLAFPCFDQPNWKATFNVTFGYHKEYKGLSNTPVRKCEKHEFLEDYIWCSHEQLLRTSTYLVAYAIHNLTNAGTVTSLTHNQVVFRNWLQPKIVNQSDFSVEMAPKILKYLEDFFQLNFPLSKIDQLISPTHKFRAMENWGLVTYQENAFVFNEAYDLQEKKETNCNTMAHEFSHQWFGNLVTMKWWKDLWLKEGPSTYFGYLVLDALQPQWEWSDGKITKDLAYFFRHDATNMTRPISRDVKNSTEVLDQFSKYVYEKGALTMRMLHKILGTENFFEGIRNYLQKYAYQNVEQTDLFSSLQEVANENINLNVVMDSWTLQEGYPLITLKRDYKKGEVKVNQKRFIQQNNLQLETQCWWVPLSFVSQSDPNFEDIQPNHWLECPSNETTLKVGTSKEWLLLNPQVYAIYRVNYDEHNWKMLINTLQNEVDYGGIPKINRVQLMDDLLALAALGEQSYDLVFELFEYLKLERDYLPCERGITLLQQYGSLLKDQAAEDFNLYLKQQLTPHYRRLPKLKLIDSIEIPVNEIAFRRFIYTQSCLYNVDDCVSQAVMLNTNDSSISVPANFRQLVYCIAIEKGTTWDFQQMMKLFKNSPTPAQQSAFASGLGCSSNFSQLKEFLDYAIHSDTKSISDCYIQAVTAALKRDNVARETKQHIFDHAEMLNKKFKRKDLEPILMHMVKELTTPEELSELKEHLKDLSQFKEPVKKVLELVETNLLWLRQYSVQFRAVLLKRIY
ncbi:aminopeptidase N [Drosophila willistoni]|uniref:aminopeptidase N n=1 Tax=Drosophila willistoni TaxID=7260 RepID=UPI000C26C926|nr:aminopeptidase N [Drosophila willistoni]